jgi:putative phosphoesterase
MKIFVFSDSHTEIGSMRNAVRAGKPDRIMHLGDHARDAEEVHRAFPDIPIDIVKGNNDFSGKYPVSKTLQLEGKNIFFTHGDLFGVKYGVERIAEKGKSENADVVLFGHTHKPYLFKHGEMWVMNPGCIGNRSVYNPKVTYGVIELRDGAVYCEIREI